MRALLLAAVAVLTACEGDIVGSRPELTATTPASVPVRPPAPGVVPGPVEPPPEPPPFAPAPALMHRLTQAQVRHALDEHFGVTVATPLPPDVSAVTFASLGAARVASNEQDVERYDAMAREVADTLATRTDRPWAGCRPTNAQDACVTDYLSSTARRLFRRAPTADELASLRAIVAAGGTDPAQLEAGLRWALVAMLQSPAFLYQSWDAQPAADGFRRLTGASLASRLAFFLWDSVPDEALLDAVDAGDLDTTEGLARTVDRMLADPRAADLGGRFFSEAWGVAALTSFSRSTTLYPAWGDALLGSMRREFSTRVNDVTAADADVRTLFDGQRGYADANLADVYGVVSMGFSPVTFDARRRGLLTSAAVLTASNTHTESSAPILRGLFVLERLLCRSMPTPPAGLLDRVLAEEVHKPARSNKTRVEERRADPTCWGCHQQMDPVGLTFEHFDGIGRHRTQAGMFAVESEGAFEGQPVSSAPDLSAMLRDDPRVTRCMTEQVLSAATGHVLRPSEERAVDAALASFQSSGFRFRALARAVATSDAFRLVAP